ncbi:MAG: ABC-three component system protein [Treponemataceae bacterium]|nr:ABC-three component system protein [Treponemataceae bacterium]
MNRESYYSIIEERLNLLSLRARRNSSLNLQNLNIHCENFYAQLFNLVFGYQFKNLNAETQNVESIDLIDETNKIIAQVSATTTKRKIENTLKKDSLKNYKDYSFVFIFISDKDAKNLRKQSFSNPSNILFNPERDIYDVTELLRKILSLDIDKMKEVYDFVCKELKPDIDLKKVDSDLVKLINILSQEDLDESLDIPSTVPFEIQKKIDFNGLGKIKKLILDNAIYSKKLNEKYEEFDKQGVNKSRAILNVLKTTYQKFEQQYDDSLQLFDKIIEVIIDKVKSEIDGQHLISIEELELYIPIIVVDAFMKCKIFKNPEEYEYATS